MDSVLIIGFSQCGLLNSLEPIFNSNYEVTILDVGENVETLAKAANRAEKILALTCLPENYIASHLTTDTEQLESAINTLSAMWSDECETLIDTVLSDREKSYVIAEELFVSPDPETIKSLSEQFLCDFSDIKQSGRVARPVFKLIAMTLLGSEHNTYSDYEELAALSNVTQNIGKYSVRAGKISEQTVSRKIDFHNQISELEQRNRKFDRDFGHANSELELSMLQIHQLQEELEQTTLALAVAKDEIEKFEKEDVQLRDTKQHDNEELKDVKSENELLLLQIHQLQEELEHYFIKATEAESKSKEYESIQYVSDVPQTTLDLLGSLNFPLSR